MTTSRVPLIVGAAIAGFMVAQWAVSSLINAVLWAVTPNHYPQLGLFGAFALPNVVQFVLECAAFGFGVFISLRFVKPIHAEDGWRMVIVRGVIATLFGAAAEVVLGLVQALFASANPGTYPFGYSFAPTINATALPQQILAAFEAAPFDVIDGVVPVVLAVMLLKLWLGRRVTAVTAPASLFETPVDH